ncbi:homoserine kinase [Modestobacter sp. I12A-02628]|uniref:Homoserine kinase n=1 Tax=Goekera deserti TaxID=2497753 RepID=A0A7K3W9E6_9ACTN|nr:homoserine kinase [Goekera deserti]NDI50084.1 homoserine kinase [Goekera deserti]NEL52440.1 homoserine kinase [Goekera deserti]
MPATSANLGPAFDCAGLALTHHDLVDVELADGLQVSVAGEGAGTLACDETHLVVRAFRAACDDLGWTPRGLRMHCVNTIPHGRGMGSSAAAVVAGIVAAWQLCPDVDTRDDDRVLALATELEGHPDNVAACLLGGATLSWTRGEHVAADRLALRDDVVPIVLVPGGTLSTHVARGLLPPVVPHADAAFAAGRGALLVHALTREPGLLLDATEDRLHQAQRAPAMPRTAELIAALRAEGHAAVVSGAGPSVLVLGVRGPDDDPSTPAAGAAARRVAALAPPDWTCLPLAVDHSGARVSRTPLG